MDGGAYAVLLADAVDISGHAHGVLFSLLLEDRAEDEQSYFEPELHAGDGYLRAEDDPLPQSQPLGFHHADHGHGGDHEEDEGREYLEDPEQLFEVLDLLLARLDIADEEDRDRDERHRVAREEPQHYVGIGREYPMVEYERDA